MDECPCCGSKDLEMLDSEIIKQESDYKIKILKVEHHFKEYKCHNCNKVVKKNIPNHLKEDIQYGSNVQATALTLLDIGNVPINKVKRIIDGLTMNEINLSEDLYLNFSKELLVNWILLLKMQSFILLI